MKAEVAEVAVVVSDDDEEEEEEEALPAKLILGPPTPKRCEPCDGSK